MIKEIKQLIESGDDFTAKQFRILSLSGMVELGEAIEDVRNEIKKVDAAAQARVCPKVLQAQRDIERLEGKSNRNDVIVAFGTIIGSIVGVFVGNK
ncbi:MAG TPA: hypothetical protein ENF22_02980 [Chloroflexi bacterium]|nr:hypothetical protein [Chloroflexota bacterium]